MKETNSFTTIIVHEVRLRLGLSCNEYCIADLVDWAMEETGWCEYSRQEIAEKLGITKQAAVRILDRLVSDGLLFKHAETKKLCTTDLWKDNFDRASDVTVKPEIVDLEAVKNRFTFITTWRPARRFTPFTN